MNYWYYSRSNEIFLDLDNKKSISRAFNVLSKTMESSDGLDVHEVFMYPTETKGHVHIIVTLDFDVPFLNKMAWSLWMANDRLRVAFVIERWRQSWKCDVEFRGDLLVGNRKYHRAPDDFCSCLEKHKDVRVTWRCPAMRTLIGTEAATADYFTRTGRIGLRPVDPVLFPWGRVDLERLKQWGESDGQENVLQHRGNDGRV